MVELISEMEPRKKKPEATSLAIKHSVLLKNIQQPTAATSCYLEFQMTLVSMFSLSQVP